MRSRQNITRREFKITFLGWAGIRNIEWRLTQESAEAFAASCEDRGWTVVSIEEADHLLDY